MVVKRQDGMVVSIQGGKRVKGQRYKELLTKIQNKHIIKMPKNKNEYRINAWKG